MTTARDEILARLRANQRPAPLDAPDGWQSRRQFDDLAARFTASLTKVYGEVHRAPSLDAALDTLGALLDDLSAVRIAVNDEAPLNTVDLSARWPGRTWHIVGRDPAPDLRPFCEAADVGLSGADAALAETGSLVLSSGPGRSRLVTLVPPVHIALVPTAALETDLVTWTQQRSGPPPANVVLVSGPSKTADIEQTMAIGVHGPKRFIVILFD